MCVGVKQRSPSRQGSLSERPSSPYDPKNTTKRGSKKNDDEDHAGLYSDRPHKGFVMEIAFVAFAKTMVLFYALLVATVLLIDHHKGSSDSSGSDSGSSSVRGSPSLLVDTSQLGMGETKSAKRDLPSCDSFLSGSGSDMKYHYSDAANMAMNDKASWQWGFSTRLAATEALQDKTLTLKYGDDVEVQRGDLVLLCVHSVPDVEETGQRLFLQRLKEVDEERERHKIMDRNKLRNAPKKDQKELKKKQKERAYLKNGRLLVGVMGGRYAPDAIHGEEISQIAPHPKLSLLGAGGTYGKAISVFQRDKPIAHHGEDMTRQYVQVSVVPVGRLTREDGTPFNIHKSAPKLPSIASSGPWHVLKPETTNSSPKPVYIFTGVAMNSGKSVSMAHFIRGLKNAGLTVGAAKVTGTDFPKDLEYYLNGGASYGLTFAEFGYSSTHSLSHSELDSIFEKTVKSLEQTGCDAIVIELADGIRAPDARYLLGESTVLRTRMTALIVAAQNGPGASKSLDEVYRVGLGNKLGAVTGIMTGAPLAVEEFRLLESERRFADGTFVGVPTVLSPLELAQGKIAKDFVDKWHPTTAASDVTEATAAGDESKATASDVTEATADDESEATADDESKANADDESKATAADETATSVSMEGRKHHVRAMMP